MKEGKEAGPTEVVLEMNMADENLGIEWLTDMCNKCKKNCSLYTC